METFVKRSGPTVPAPFGEIRRGAFQQGDALLLSASAIDAQQAAATALEYRPEINQAFLQFRAATIREKMSRNELMPELNLVLEGSLGGLSSGDSRKRRTRWRKPA